MGIIPPYLCLTVSSASADGSPPISLWPLCISVYLFIKGDDIPTVLMDVTTNILHNYGQLWGVKHCMKRVSNAWICTCILRDCSALGKKQLYFSLPSAFGMLYADMTTHSFWFHLCYWLNSQACPNVCSDKGTPGCCISRSPPGCTWGHCKE